MSRPLAVIFIAFCVPCLWPQPISAVGADARSAETSPDGGLDATIQLSYPGRRQSRTIVQGLLLVAADTAETTTINGTEFCLFELQGKVYRQEELFEDFRYRFEVPRDETTDARIPLVIERTLRPGIYKIAFDLEDLNSKEHFTSEQDIENKVTTAGKYESEFNKKVVNANLTLTKGYLSLDQ